MINYQPQLVSRISSINSRVRFLCLGEERQRLRDEKERRRREAEEISKKTCNGT